METWLTKDSDGVKPNIELWAKYCTISNMALPGPLSELSTTRHCQKGALPKVHSYFLLVEMLSNKSL